MAPRYGQDGRVYFLLEDSGTQRLVSVPAAGGPISEATSEKVVYGYDLGPVERLPFMPYVPNCPVIFLSPQEASPGN